MSKIIAFTNLTLDGVMQAPALPDEDTRGGFEHGGWAVPYNAQQDAGESIANMGAVLFGRWTYESFYSYWPNQTDNPFTGFFNNIPKYVASRTLTEPLAWENSTLLAGDAADAVAKLKEEPGKDIVIFGSGDLIQSLTQRNLIDEYVIMIHPLVLGSGRRLFAEGVPAESLQLRNTKTTNKGVVVATYQPAEGVAGKSV